MMGDTTTTFGVRTLLGEKASALDTATLLEESLVVHGDPGRFAPFADIPQLRSATAVIAAWDGTLKMARAWSPPGGAAFELHPMREQIRTLYDAGFTIILEGIESFIPALRPLCRALERDLGVAPGRVNVEVFCAREGGRGRPHFDPSFTFNCQIEGVKTWRLSRSTAVRFPSTGMFLGRTPDPDLEECLTGRLPDSIEDGQTFIAQPGSVVFLPPGVLHETSMDTASFAIAFAIEETDTIAGRVAARARRTLQRIPELRAARLGAQKQLTGDEVSVVVRELRRLADAIESTNDLWSDDADRIRLRPGLSVDIVNETSITLRGTCTSRTISLDPAMVVLLGWASDREQFVMRDVTRELSTLDPLQVSRCVQKLIHAGLMDRVP